MPPFSQSTGQDSTRSDMYRTRGVPWWTDEQTENNTFLSIVQRTQVVKATIRDAGVTIGVHGWAVVTVFHPSQPMAQGSSTKIIK